MDAGFFERVYEIVRQVPPGCVTSYGQISWLLGVPRAARQVGWAMRHCPDELPWQRVVRADGSIAGGGYAEMRRALLEAEGVPFTADGRVDMERASGGPKRANRPRSRARRVGRARLPRRGAQARAARLIPPSPRNPAAPCGAGRRRRQRWQSGGRCFDPLVPCGADSKQYLEFLIHARGMGGRFGALDFAAPAMLSIAPYMRARRGTLCRTARRAKAAAPSGALCRGATGRNTDAEKRRLHAGKDTLSAAALCAAQYWQRWCCRRCTARSICWSWAGLGFRRTFRRSPRAAN